MTHDPMTKRPPHGVNLLKTPWPMTQRPPYGVNLFQDPMTHEHHRVNSSQDSINPDFTSHRIPAISSFYFPVIQIQIYMKGNSAKNCQAKSYHRIDNLNTISQHHFPAWSKPPFSPLPEITDKTQVRNIPEDSKKKFQKRGMNHERRGEFEFKEIWLPSTDPQKVFWKRGRGVGVWWGRANPPVDHLGSRRNVACTSLVCMGWCARAKSPRFSADSSGCLSAAFGHWSYSLIKYWKYPKQKHIKIAKFLVKIVFFSL